MILRLLDDAAKDSGNLDFISKRKSDEDVYDIADLPGRGVNQGMASSVRKHCPHKADRETL